MLDDEIIFLDNASTTKVNTEVLALYNKVSDSLYANSGSIHGFGMKTNHELDSARESILNSLKFNNLYRVIFTSGATEANNLFLKGMAFKNASRGKHIIISAVEHPSITEAARQLEQFFNYELTILPVNSNGNVEPEILEKAMRNDTIIVSIMAVNNEVGSINNINALSAVIRKYPKCLFHVDATQSIGKVDINFNNVDAISFSSHKIHGLKGNGCLILKKTLDPISLSSGGGQEDNLRSGTVNVAGAISTAKALQIAEKELKMNLSHIKSLHDALITYLSNNSSLYEINSSLDNPFIVNFSLKEKKAAVIVEGLSNKNIMVSSVSACHSHDEPVSEVILAMGKSYDIAHNSIRVSFDYSNKMSDIDALISALEELVKGIRK